MAFYDRKPDPRKHAAVSSYPVLGMNAYLVQLKRPEENGGLGKLLSMLAEGNNKEEFLQLAGEAYDWEKKTAVRLACV